MLSDFLTANITSQAGFIVANGYGYGQVEPNHLSAQRTGQIYAQLPAAADINVLEQGQFVKYDYANGVCNFSGPGEWLLVYNEIKLYRENQLDCEFAMIKGNYTGRVYSPFGGAKADGAADVAWTKQSRWYNGKDSDNNTSITLGAYTNYKLATTYDSEVTYYADNKGTALDEQPADATAFAAGTFYEVDTANSSAGTTYTYTDVTAPADMYEPAYNVDPFHIAGQYKEALMPTGTTMIPRCLKTNIGDIYTTNTIKDTSVTLGAKLVPNASNKGILEVKANPTSSEMVWQAVKIYTMPDHQPGVKVMRIQ